VMRTSYLLLLLFLSGAGTLVLEVCWFRRMAQVAGATSVAMGAVLAAVIGGMAAGSFLIGRLADRSPRPLRLYGLLEAGIAISALVTPWLLDASEGAFDFLLRHLLDKPGAFTLARFLLATALLALPALLMGGSLPAIACAIRTAPGRRGGALGGLYAANTLGAVAGTFAAGFLLLPVFGLAGATRFAFLLSGAAALLAFLPRTAGVDPFERRTGVPAPQARRAIALYAASGFLGLAAEVAFTRRLVLVLGSTTYAFTTTLGVFLLGIGLGGALGALLARRRTGHLRMLEITVATTAALFSLATLVVYLLPRLYLNGIVGWADTWSDGLLLRFLLCLPVLLPGALGLGVAFPLAAHLATAGSLGAGTGRLYAANTLASIVGSTTAVFLLLPLLGPDLTVVATALAVAGFAALRFRLIPGVLVLVTAIGLLSPPPEARERLLSGVYSNPGAFLREDRIDEKVWSEGVDFPYVDDGREATVAVMRWYGTHTLMINGKAVANNESLGVVQHLSLLGHVPMAVHRDPKRVLVVGLGMGTTFTACEMYEPTTLRVVELEGAVVGAAASLGVHPRDIVIADARSYLRGTRERFDVITSDPIHPWVRGGGDLYSLEYFESCREKLAPGGVCCQWLPVHQLGLLNLTSILRTFAAAFPGVSAYYGGGDLILIGMAEGPVPEPRVVTGIPARALAELGLTDLAALEVANGERLREAVGEGVLVTDDSLRLEFSAPKFVDFHGLSDCLRWIENLWDGAPFPLDLVLASQIQWATGEYDEMWKSLSLAREIDPDDRFVACHIGELNLYDVEAVTARGEFDLAEKILDRAKRLLPGDPRLLGVEADLRIAAGEPARARELLQALLEDAPDSVYLRRRLAALPPAESLASREDRAVLSGMAFMEKFLDEESNRQGIGIDAVYIFLELAATSIHPEIRSRALALARRYAGPSATALLAAKAPLTRVETIELLELLAEAKVLGLDVPPLRKRAEEALATRSSFEALYKTAFDDLAFLESQELFETVMSIYSVAKAEAIHGEAFRVEPGVAEVLGFLAELPLVSAADDPSEDRALFRENAYLVTHVAYLLTDYNRIRLLPADAPWLDRYLKENFAAVLAARDVELVAEFIDVFRSMGRTAADDERVRAGTEFLLATQNPDGSWGTREEGESAYQALHDTWCAVCGLRRRSFLVGSAYEGFLRGELEGR
jgi:spermidine synthase